MERKPVCIPWTYRNGHMFMTGTTGSGKSRLLLHIAQQIVNRDEGLIFIEPHGSSSDALIRLLANTSKTVHVIDFASTHCIPFNPLWCPPGVDPSVIAGCALDAVSVSRSDEPMHTKPTTERVLMTIFYTAAALNLTLLEVPMLLDQDDSKGLRAYAIEHIQDPYTRSDLQRLHKLSRDGRRTRDFDQEVIGPLNRLARLIRPKVLRNMLGQKNTLDIGAVMDRGEIIVAKLTAGPQVYEADADLFGKLLLRSILFHAKRRTTSHACTVMIDEASRFFSGDIPTILTEIRKFNVSVIAALQYLQQAEQHDENMLAALLNCCNVQVAFRAGDVEESEKRAYTMVPLNLEKPVDILIKPTVVGHQKIRLNNESDSTQESTTDSTSQTHGEKSTVSVTHGSNRSVTNGTSKGVSDTHTTSNTLTNSDTESDLVSKSSMKASSKGVIATDGDSVSETVWTQDGVISPTVHVSSRSMRGTSENHGETSGTSEASSEASAKGRNKTKGTSNGTSNAHGTNSNTSTAVTEGENVAVTHSRGRSYTETTGFALTRGTGKSRGSSEALEPILKDLPTAVHGKENMLYKAGQLLKSLPKGTAFVSFVTNEGPLATLFTVPPIFIKQLSPETLYEVMSRSHIALTMEQAQQNIAEKETPKIEVEKKGTWRRK
jgi:hypothetical protein